MSRLLSSPVEDITPGGSSDGAENQLRQQQRLEESQTGNESSEPSQLVKKPATVVPAMVDDNDADDVATQVQLYQRLVRRGSRSIHVLRTVVLLLLLITGTIVCVGMAVFQKENEAKLYQGEFEANAYRVIDSFHVAVERKIAAIQSLSTDITSYALDSNKTFPFVTVPHFEVKGSDLRVQADAVVVHWLPLVTDTDRSEWERYASQNFGQINESFQNDANYRVQQDAQFGYGNTTESDNLSRRRVQDSPTISLPFNGSIWDNGAVTGVKGAEPVNTGPYLPAWQRSPINGAQEKLINLNFANSKVLKGGLPALLNDGGRAIMSPATIPLPEYLDVFRENLMISQYRHEFADIVEDPLTFISYPVFDSFDVRSRQIAGVLATNIYWKLFFTNVYTSLPVVCVLRNSFQQTLSYRVEGNVVEFLGQGDDFVPNHGYLPFKTNVNRQIEESASPASRSYTAVPISQEYGVYTLEVHPAEEIEYSNLPWIFAVVVAATIMFISALYVCYTVAVEHRQRMTMNQAVASAQRAAQTERELNEFLSHEVRNPLSAAISACTFVDAALKDFQRQSKLPGDKFVHNSQEQSANEQTESFLAIRDDVKIIWTSLNFVNEFLRSMLDIHRAAAKKLELTLRPADIVKDVLEPVTSMLYQRDADVTISIVCQPDLFVVTDSLRLKQVILNLGRNSAKFVEKGFIRLRGNVVNGLVELSVEDSGTGIPFSKRAELFTKFQTSLDSNSQGTGFGLSLCKSLMTILDGEIQLDDEYNSGIPGFPGSRFVVQLRAPPLDLKTLEKAGNGSASSTVVGNLRSAPINQRIHRIDDDSTSSTSESISNTSLPENLKVLFVDDDMMLRKLFSRAVKKVAPTWSIDEAASGEVAVRNIRQKIDERKRLPDEKVAKDVYDIIFMDMYMASTEKQMLGTEAVRTLRSDGIHSIICGLSANDLSDKFISHGADAFLPKPMPCRPAELRSELLRVIAAGGNGG